MKDESIKSRPINLKAFIDYSPGSIVSKALIDKKAGTVTLFAFDRGQGLSEHSAPYDVLVQIIEGESEIIIGGEAHRVRAGEVIIMPADVPHAVKAPEQFKMLLVMIRS
ncbi:MAG TPA: cupin domain-containing protein [Candidatus Syntrophoarchaeum butanivorans]|uniref:Cupin domain-containing protein n=1 Tax=Candidatus Syntropharchaeum butanivorans TaxID=1839936 RepID=A0A1F2P3Z4_9EURY|nr:MAG: cupin domain-containing protein [Candidatus Syntrophoarchaeum butanivorans]HEC56757.1 cupin domain-containing protein [Candidatus Syntrophoarchaeum butanivorans]